MLEVDGLIMDVFICCKSRQYFVVLETNFFVDFFRSLCMDLEFGDLPSLNCLKLVHNSGNLWEVSPLLIHVEAATLSLLPESLSRETLALHHFLDLLAHGRSYPRHFNHQGLLPLYLPPGGFGMLRLLRLVLLCSSWSILSHLGRHLSLARIRGCQYRVERFPFFSFVLGVRNSEWRPCEGRFLLS